MSFRFEQPEVLLLGLLAVPLVFAGWRMLRDMDRVRRWSILTLRSLLFFLLVFMRTGHLQSTQFPLLRVYRDGFLQKSL